MRHSYWESELGVAMGSFLPSLTVLEETPDAWMHRDCGRHSDGVRPIVISKYIEGRVESRSGDMVGSRGTWEGGMVHLLAHCLLTEARFNSGARNSSWVHHFSQVHQSRGGPAAEAWMRHLPRESTHPIMPQHCQRAFLASELANFCLQRKQFGKESFNAISNI